MRLTTVEKDVEKDTEEREVQRLQQIVRDRRVVFEAATVGTAVLNDPAGRARHEIDVVGLADGETLHRRGARVQVLGEAKATKRARGTADLARLERIRALLAGRGHDVASTRLMVFSRSGFDRDLRASARDRTDVELIDLERLYLGS